ncbi:triose-phosphate isomerase [Rhizobium gallicum]|uniref:triose-phosphate isomerase n=1 Tax=Rhizobium gallicum TaxID=56730 RepID=UPI0012EB213D|nr:triose-phosphate isomerase [Rhizobium gallicum]
MRKLIAGSWKIHGLASSLAEIEALKGLTSEAACDIVVRSPFTPIENPRSARRVRPRLPSRDTASERRRAPAPHTSGRTRSSMGGACLVILGHSERRAFQRRH